MLVFNNKRGGAIVEATMVFPIVIMSVVVLIFMMIYFYGQLCERVDMHIMLRAESGIKCDNMFYLNGVDANYPVYMKTQQIYSIGTVEIDQKFILKNQEKIISARKYLIDEEKFVRMAGVLEGGLESGDE